MGAEEDAKKLSYSAEELAEQMQNMPTQFAKTTEERAESTVLYYKLQLKCCPS